MNVASYVQTSVNRIAQFNDMCGNLENVDKDSIDLQLNIFWEEVCEMFKAFDENDDVELLDGAVDSLVVLSGLLLKMEKAGFKVAEAMERIDLNNLSKFVKIDDPKINEVKQDALSKGYTFEPNYGYGRVVIKDVNGKVRKPSTFKPVEIGDCAVAGFLKESV